MSLSFSTNLICVQVLWISNTVPPSPKQDPTDQPPIRSIHPWCFDVQVQETWPVRIIQVFFETMDQQMQVIASAQQNPVLLKGWWIKILHVNHCQTAVRLFDPSLVPLFDRWFVRSPVPWFVRLLKSDWLIGTFFFGVKSTVVTRGFYCGLRDGTNFGKDPSWAPKETSLSYNCRDVDGIKSGSVHSW